MSDKNIGSKNRIASQALDLLNRAFQGETVLVPPMWSDVELISSSGNNVGTVPTMFFVAPIKNDQGEIIAVVARQIDPSQDFTRLIQLGTDREKAGKHMPLAAMASCSPKVVLMRICEKPD